MSSTQHGANSAFPNEMSGRSPTRSGRGRGHPSGRKPCQVDLEHPASGRPGDSAPPLLRSPAQAGPGDSAKCWVQPGELKCPSRTHNVNVRRTNPFELSVAMRWQNQNAPRKLAPRREVVRGRGGHGAPSSLPQSRGERGDHHQAAEGRGDSEGRAEEGRAEERTAGLAPRAPAQLGPGRKGRGARPPGAPARARGRRRGREPHPCRPRARRRLWSRQSSRNAAPASEEFRAVKYLLKAAMAPAGRASRGARGTRRRRQPPVQEARGRLGGELGAQRASERARAGPAARERPPARAAAAAAAPSPPRTLAFSGARAGAGRWKGSPPPPPPTTTLTPGGRPVHARTPADSPETRRVLGCRVRGRPRFGLVSSACTHPGFHKTWKSGPGLRRRTRGARPLRHPLDESAPPP